MYLPHWCVLWITLVTASCVSCPSNALICSLISLTSSSIFFLLVLVKSGLCYNYQFDFSSLFLKWAACSSISMAKVTSRLTPVSQLAFDVAHIWVKLNIRSRSKLALVFPSFDVVSTFSTRCRLLCFATWVVFSTILTCWKNQCSLWPGSDVPFDPNMSHIKGKPTDRCQSNCHFSHGCWQMSISA